MRIAHLPSSYLPDALGGTEVYVSTLVDALRELGVENCVLVHGVKASTTPDPPELTRLASVGTVNRRDLYARTSGNNATEFKQFLNEWQPDVVHFHAFTLGAGIDHARALKQANVPYVITYHTPAQSCPRGTLMRNGESPCDGTFATRRCSECLMQAKRLPRWLGKLAAMSPIPSSLPDGPWMSYVALPSLLQIADQTWSEFFGGAAAIVACANFCKEVLVANSIPAEKIRVFRQALPGATRTRSLRTVRDPNHVRIGYFGRVTHVKGVDVAAQAVEQLLTEGMLVTFEIVGPVGAGDHTWFDRILKTPQTTYHGTLRGTELKRWLQDLDLVVIPSRWLETGPLTLLEAWDQSTPVIGTNAGGIQDFIAGAGHLECLFQNESPHELADCIRSHVARCQPLPDITIPGMLNLANDHVGLYRNVMGL